MEYCSLLWGGAPASHLARLHAVENKAFRIIGISHDEAFFGSLTLSPEAGRWSFCLLRSPLWSCAPALSAICPPYISAGRQGQVRSGMGACARAASRCIHFLPVLQGPPSGHLPGRCLAHPHLLVMLINLLQPRGRWSVH